MQKPIVPAGRHLALLGIQINNLNEEHFVCNLYVLYAVDGREAATLLTAPSERWGGGGAGTQPLPPLSKS